VVRFTNKDVHDNLSEVVEAIRRACGG
jgi:hypothetical protein